MLMLPVCSRYLRPNVSFSNEAGIVTTPVAASPSRALIQEFDVVLERRLNFAFLIVLNPSFPLVRDQPSSYKVVIVRIELEFTPALGLEPVEEERTLKDLRTERASATRHTRCATINAMSCRDFEVASFDISCAKPIVVILAEGSRAQPLNTLTWPNTTDLGILERSQEPWKYCPWPRDVVIRHYDKSRLDLGDCLAYLNALVGNGYLENPNIGSLQGLDEFHKSLIFVRGGDEEKFKRLASQNALQRFSQFFEIVVNCGNDNRDIIWSVRWFDWDRNTSIRPMANGIDNETGISVEPASRVLAFGFTSALTSINSQHFLP